MSLNLHYLGALTMLELEEPFPLAHTARKGGTLRQGAGKRYSSKSEQKGHLRNAKSSEVKNGLPTTAMLCS